MSYVLHPILGENKLKYKIMISLLHLMMDMAF